MVALVRLLLVAVCLAAVGAGWKWGDAGAAIAPTTVAVAP